jgi:acyl-CoA hydrolase
VNRKGEFNMKEILMKDSKVMQTKLVLPLDTNNLGTMFGGRVLAFIDEMAAIVSMKHSASTTVTASIDSVDFLSPVKVGDILSIEGLIAYTGRSSMEVYVRVIKEDWKTKERVTTTTSFVTMVAINEEGKTIEVPKIVPQSEEEKEIYESALKRKQQRI